MSASTADSAWRTAPHRLKPRLAFFYAPTSGPCRRLEGFLAQVLQHRRNHETFDLVRVNVEERPDLRERFHVEKLPTLLVIEDRTVRLRIVAPRSSRVLEQELAEWLK